MEFKNKKPRLTPVVSPLFTCKTIKCRDSSAVTTIQCKEDEHRVNVRCISCNQFWVVCVSCTRRFEDRKIYLANQHFDLVHSSNSNMESNGRTSSGVDDTEQFTIDPQNQSQIIQFCLSESSMTLNSRNFFQKKAVSLPYAIQNLVGQAFSQSFSSSTLPTLAESTFHLELANLLSALPTTYHLGLIRLLNSARDLDFTSTRLPMESNDILRFYTKYKYSLCNQLPTPTCHVSEYHAFVHLRAVIEHYIAFGFHTDDNNLNQVSYSPSSTILQCTEVIDLHRNTMAQVEDDKKMSTITLFLMIWSDDFEPSTNLFNKHSTWMRTVTICANKGFGVSSEHTYLLSLGFKKDNHEEMNDILVKELEDLSKGKWMYSGKYKSRVFVITKLLVMSADRPERNSLTQILGHNGLTTRRWKYTSFIRQDKLPSCKFCLMKRLSQYIVLNNLNHASRISVCQLCCDWDYGSQCRFMKTDLPEKYPRKQHPTSPIPPKFRHVLNIRYLVPVEQTFDWLRQGCRFCFHNVYHQVWNLGTSDEYIRCLGLSQGFNRKYIVEKAKILFAKNPNHPNPSSTMTFPPLWNVHTELYRFIDIPMHLLFLGIIKSTIDLTFEWLKLHKAHTAFGNKVDQFHIQIKQLQLSFCKLEVFKSGQEVSTSGWRAENYLAYARIMMFSFSFVRGLIPNQNDYKHEIDSFELLHHTCLCMISRLMTPNSVPKKEVDDYIKIFLSILDIGERLIFTESASDMFWYQRSNFLSLLNLPDQIERFGSVRNYWEGSRERFIQFIKPLMKSTRESTSYLKIQFEKLNKGQLINNLYKEVNVESEAIRYDRFKALIIYDNIEHVNNVIREGGPLSLLKDSQLIKATVYVGIKHVNDIRLHEVIFDDRNGQNICCLFYASIRVKLSNDLAYPSTKDINYDVFCPCVGLSLNAEDETKHYTCLSSDWLYRSKEGSFTLPSLNSSIAFFVNTFM